MYRSQLSRRTVERLAFTLMEILVVVAIIVALMGVGGYYVLGQYKEGLKKVARTNAHTIAKAVETYTLDHRGTPPTDLNQLLGKDENGNGPYLTSASVLKDPWGGDYKLDTNGSVSQRLGDHIDVYTVYGGITYGNWDDGRK